MIPKFRAYSTKENEMYYPHNDKNVDWTIDDETGFIAPLVNLGSGMWGMIDKYELMQSVGVRDKNAKCEIYRKDILLVETLSNVSFKAKVVYEQGSFGIVALKGDIVDYFPKHWNDTFMPLAELYWIFDCEDGVLDCVEILGNEFKNPELLEEQR
ncbi:YopX family protein [Enterococcus mundtii]|uniref:YopX family protein n=1 Tax=Enterococcus mundtii TaxID=53346 RepID=UPI0032DF1786